FLRLPAWLNDARRPKQCKAFCSRRATETTRSPHTICGSITSPSACSPPKGRGWRAGFDSSSTGRCSSITTNCRTMRPMAPAKRSRVGLLPLAHGTQPIRLVKVDLAPDESAWVFDEDTVRAIDRLYERHGPPFAEKLHAFFFNHSFLSLELWQWLGLLVVILGGALAAIILKGVIFAIPRRAGPLENLRRA